MVFAEELLEKAYCVEILLIDSGVVEEVSCIFRVVLLVINNAIQAF